MGSYNANYLIVPVDTGGRKMYVAKAIATGKDASPQYSDIQALIYFLNEELKREMEEQVEKLLGASE